VRQDPLGLDLDDKGLVCLLLQNNFGSCNCFVFLLYFFSHVDLQLIHIHLMRHFLSAYWGTKSETNNVEKVFTNDVFTMESTTTFLFANDTRIMMRTDPQPF
jgi:hypothetical protein